MNLDYALRRAGRAATEHPLLVLATVTTVGTLLLLFGTFLLVVRNLGGILDRWADDVQISCYLDDGVADEAAFGLLAEIEALPEVESVRYVSRDEALRRFAGAMPGAERIVADLDRNPLPASLEVRLIPELQASDAIERFARRLDRPEFKDMDWSRTWVERYAGFVRLLRISAMVLGALILGATVVLVSNTMRLVVLARRDEIELSTLLGGTPWFVRAPLLIEGGAEGLLGGFLALMLLAAVHSQAGQALGSGLAVVFGEDGLLFLRPIEVLGLLAGGALAGLAGTWSSMRRADVH
jgi:cell division transport system permease protein